MQARPAIAAIAIALGGCTLEAPAVTPGPTPPVPAPGGICDARGGQGAVGRPYDDALGEDLRRRTGAERVRVVRPGQMVTMEFNERRLTVELDARGRVAAVRCG